MDLHIAGKVALVTGGSRGLGFATARALLLEGCDTVLCARGVERLEEARRELGATAAHGGAQVATIAADVSTREGITRVIEGAVSTFGGLDILVNNVGVARGSDLEGTTDADWQDAFDQTFYPAVRVSRAALPHMRKRGGGTIVMVSSIYGREAGGRMTYNAVKAAEISLTKSLAQQLARENIRVVGIAPGSILFPGGSWHKRQQADPAGIADFVARDLPFGRFGRPEEVGDVIAFLASSKASWISGTTVVVDGCQSRMF
jgi:3-oxoacyl-[acyl-carrier protein] reductase